MRLAAATGIALAVCTAFAQDATIRTTVPLVVVPTSVTDRSGHPVYGLNADDFVVLDNGTERVAHVDTSDGAPPPVALAVVVQTSGVSSAALAKIQKVGAMIPEAVVGESGEAAVLSFDDRVNMVQDFTHDADRIANAFRDLKAVDSDRARMIDAVEKSLDLLAARPEARRRSILIIGETRDRGSESKLQDLIGKTERAGVTIYALNYSAWLTPFTAKPEDYNPPNGGMPSYTEAFVALARLGKKNTAQVLTALTGGRRIGFETQSKLEDDLITLGTEIHSRYLISFTPEQERQPNFHKIQIAVKNRPDAVVKARSGYWAAVSQPNR